MLSAARCISDAPQGPAASPAATEPTAASSSRSGSTSIAISRASLKRRPSPLSSPCRSHRRSSSIRAAASAATGSYASGSTLAKARGWPATELRVVSVLKQLAGVLAGDPRSATCARIMRLPGTTTPRTALAAVLVLPCSTWAEVVDDLVDMLDVQRPLLRPSNTPPAAVQDNPFLAVAARFLQAADRRGRRPAMTDHRPIPHKRH